MRVSEIFASAGGDRGGYGGYTGGRETYLRYGTVEKPGGYYPDNGRWTYVAPDNYNWQPTGNGYGFTHSHRQGTFLG
ncbi:MAG TPA: hypothetical protein VE673_06440 [Pseudonocardiaceae bacterium]|jgi:hypothetical protein|nr:hypothetical protein [Pseudonocardiaceae bacterium]